MAGVAERQVMAGRVSSDPDELSLVEIIDITLANASRIALCGVAAALVALLFVAWRGLRYEAQSMFKPETSDSNLGQFAGLAAQFGFDMSALSGGGESVEFYANLVRSRELLRAAVLTEYRFAKDEDGKDSVVGNLLDIYQVDADDKLEDRVAEGVKRLEKSLSVSRVIGAGMLRMSVRARWAELAVAVNRRLLDLVNEFNLQRRQSEASKERLFAEDRLEAARHELELAESELASFLERNRTYSSSPQLTFEEGRLQRRVDLRSQVQLTLAQAVERARIDEVRNTPVVIVIDQPRTAEPVITLPVIVILGFVLGSLASFSVVFVAQYLHYRSLRAPEDDQRLLRVLSLFVRRPEAAR